MNRTVLLVLPGFLHEIRRGLDLDFPGDTLGCCCAASLPGLEPGDGRKNPNFRFLDTFCFIERCLFTFFKRERFWCEDLLKNSGSWWSCCFLSMDLSFIDFNQSHHKMGHTFEATGFCHQKMGHTLDWTRLNQFCEPTGGPTFRPFKIWRSLGGGPTGGSSRAAGRVQACGAPGARCYARRRNFFWSKKERWRKRSEKVGDIFVGFV